jgi:hypothetical protein
VPHAAVRFDVGTGAKLREGAAQVTKPNETSVGYLRAARTQSGQSQCQLQYALISFSCKITTGLERWLIWRATWTGALNQPGR